MATNSLGRKPPTPKRRYQDVRIFCTCDAYPGSFHEIVPGVCPETYSSGPTGTRVSLMSGEEPGTLRLPHPPVPRDAHSGETVTLIPQGKAAEPAARTSAAIETAHRAAVRRNLRPSTIETWTKRWQAFAAIYPSLPQEREEVLTYLDRFSNPKYRNAQADALRALYRYANEGGMDVANPLQGVRAALVPAQPVYTLSLEEVRTVNALEMDERERVIWELLVGHGWRQVEVRNIQAKDVREARDGQMWIRGKMRDEMTPILPETLARLQEMAAGLPESEPVVRTREDAGASHDTVRRLAVGLLKRAGIKRKPHELRKTFATLVTEASGDEVLAMRLIRDRLPGQAGVYVHRKLPELLERFSPLRQLAWPAGESDDAPGLDTHAPSAWVEGGEGPFTASSGAGGSAWESNPPRNGKPPRQRF